MHGYTKFRSGELARSEQGTLGNTVALNARNAELV